MDALSHYLVHVVIPTIVASTVAAVGAVVVKQGKAIAVEVASWFERKTHLGVQAQLSQLVESAVDYAEEQALKWAKAHGGAKLEGPAMLKLAESYVVTRAAKYGIPAELVEEVEHEIEAAVNARRPTASGSTLARLPSPPA